MIATPNPQNTDHPYDVVMDVTPQQAITWLEGNTHNRPVKQTHVDRLAQEIKAGRWRLTHQGIAFDTGGLLADGQHRLWAIIEAGMSVPVRVFFNEPPENRHVLDSGERRSNLDILTITGEVGDVTAKHLAALRSMLAGISSHPRRMSPGEEAVHFTKHRAALDFAVDHLNVAKAKGVATAMTRAIIARAFYSADHGKLTHFCNVMKSGIATGESDNVIILLWQFLMRTADAGRTDAGRQLRYAKMEWALSAFLKGDQPKRLMSNTTELFPLREELKPQEAAAAVA